jgi:hypothetical protein
MTNLDQAIRRALSAEDAEFLAKFEKDAPLHEQVFGAFTGPFGGLNVLGVIFTFAMFGAFSFAMFGAFCYCVWQFFNVSEMRDLIFWSAAALWSAVAVGMLKIWFWMEMHKNQVLREVKRLELQVARLASRETV